MKKCALIRKVRLTIQVYSICEENGELDPVSSLDVEIRESSTPPTLIDKLYLSTKIPTHARSYAALIFHTIIFHCFCFQCRKYFVIFNFVVFSDYENISIMKISGFTVLRIKDVWDGISIKIPSQWLYWLIA